MWVDVRDEVLNLFESQESRFLSFGLREFERLQRVVWDEEFSHCVVEHAAKELSGYLLCSWRHIKGEEFAACSSGDAVERCHP